MPRSLLRPPLAVRPLEDRANPSTAYLATDLISDQLGVAPVTDPTLVNAWGIALNGTNAAVWISANGTDLSEVYGRDANGNPLTQPFKVAIPGGAPTGQVFNGSTDFAVTDGTTTRPSAFIFASEAGMITGWNPAVGIAPGATPPSLTAEVGYAAPDGAVYKGLALAKVGSANFLFAADFHNNKIDVLDGGFHLVAPNTNGFESFTDPNLPAGYAPFNVAAIGGKLYVSYAKQDADAHDDVAGPGHGLIDVFETNGRFDMRLVSRGVLNSPWGMVQAPAAFGDFGGALLVGNFGDGRINAFNLTTGQFLSTLSESPGHPLVIDGLWGLAFGNGKTPGDTTSLYYAAGPDDEAHGLFGKVTANAAGTNPVTAKQSGDTLTITGSRDDDRVRVRLDNHDTMLTVNAGNDRIGQFDASTMHTIRFNGFAGNDQFRVDDDVTATVIADGGAGNDILSGGGGNNVLLGGPGNDLLLGGRTRDILIGGTGRDILIGFDGGDILVGGSTAYYANPAALTQILTVWAGPDSYTARVAAIRAGTGGVPKLDATTVIDDGVPDLLVGGPGQDWFIGTAPPDIFAGIRADELVN